MELVNELIKVLINRARVARLATIDSDKTIPHIIPVVFVFDGYHYYIPLDGKRKKRSILQLKRVKNILKNPDVTLLIDEYDEDWRKLSFVLIQGKAFLINQETEIKVDSKYHNNHVISIKNIHKLLYEKYPQYNKVKIGQYCIAIKPQKTIYWKNC